jgi:hypothetical protein
MNALVHHLNLVKPSSPFDQAPRIEILCGAVNPSASRRVKGDERLLGSSDFVERVLESWPKKGWRRRPSIRHGASI